MAAAAAAARPGRRRVTHRQGTQGGAWRPATAASRRHEAALTVPSRSVGVSPLLVAARSARTRAPQRVVAAAAITASRGGRGRRGRCRPHPPLWLTTATGARHPPAGDTAANTRAARGAAAGGHLGGGAGGWGGRPPVCIRGDSGVSARRRRVGWHGHAGDDAGNLPSGAGAATAAAAGWWSLAGDRAAWGAAAHAAAGTAHNVSPLGVAGRPRPRHGGGGIKNSHRTCSNLCSGGAALVVK